MNALAIAVVLAQATTVAQSAEPQTTAVLSTQYTSTVQGLKIDDLTRLDEVDKARAKAWGLTEAEYTEFKRLMALSPRGSWTPNIDPITALGVSAKTDAEREHYARLQIDIENKRRDGENAFQEAMYRVLRKEYPDHSLWKSTFEARRDRNAAMKPEMLGELDIRTLLFLPADCDADCTAFARNITSATGTGARVDVFVLGTSSDDSKIQFLAKKIGLSPDVVKKGLVTLNHDGGSYESMRSRYPTATAPVALRIGVAGQELVKP